MDSIRPGGKNGRISRRELKRQASLLLQTENVEKVLEQLSRLPGRRAVNVLFSFLCDRNEKMKWFAVTAMGHVVAALAENDMEAARTVVRRLMWNLNDESGGIGWGSPEAMGEILATHGGLASEYASILISYIKPEANYLEHPFLQRGLIWAIGRLAQSRPLLTRDAAPYIASRLSTEDKIFKGYGAWAIGLMGWKEGRPFLAPLLEDESEFCAYLERRFLRKRISEMAREALDRL